MVRLTWTEEAIEDQDWCLWLSKIMPSLEDLHQAIRLQDSRKVTLLVSQKPINVNSSLRSCTALSLAVYQGSIEIVRILLENGAMPDKLSRDWNERFETPLFSACRLGHYEIVQLLLEYKADVNITDFYMHTPLWIATRERKSDLVELLIKYGANLNIADKWQQCPLYLATKYLGREDIAKSLIRHGCKLDLTDVEGHGVLYWSLANNQLEIFRLLVIAGAHINGKDRQNFLSDRNLPQDVKENPMFCEWLQNELKNPPTLQRLSAKTIRQHLGRLNMGRTIQPSIQNLPISKEMKQMLLLVGL